MSTGEAAYMGGIEPGSFQLGVPIAFLEEMDVQEDECI